MRVALVLGSGGARGYAHIGIIDELKARGHEIVAISGTSMGALVGGLEAVGKLNEFAQWATNLTHLDVWRKFDFTLTGAGLLKAEKIFGEMNPLFGDARIEDLPIPFTAVAADITAQREVWFQRGPLAAAIRASIAIPGVITPVMMRDHVLVDGGVCNPVPIEPTLSVPSDVTIAISLAGRPMVISAHEPTTADDVREISEGSSLFSRLPFVGRKETDTGSGTSATADASEIEDDIEQGSTESTADMLRPAGRKTAGTMEVINNSIDTMKGMIERYRAAPTPAQVQITIPYDAAGTMDFHRAADLIELGRDYAVKAFDAAGL